ncbi:MAG: Maf family protein [Desulfovibrio sp.]
MEESSIKSRSIFITQKDLILASGSPRRIEFLQGLGLRFNTEVSRAEEPAPEADERPEKYARRMARLKAEEVATRFPDHVIIGADTIVVVDDKVLGKPKGTGEEAKADALRMLTMLSGRSHQVMTGFCIIEPGSSPLTETVSTDVSMRISEKYELEAYIETGEPMDKAGSYAIQGIGGFLVQEINGSYSNVVGLPVTELIENLLGIGALATTNTP